MSANAANPRPARSAALRAICVATLMAHRHPLTCGMANIGLNPMTSSLGDKLLTTSPILIFLEVLEIGRRKFPIHQLVDHRIDMIRALVLVIKIVRMFPDVDRQQR